MQPPGPRFELDSYVSRGCESELLEVFSRTRIVTLTGPRGVGKSRLAAHVAQRALDRFPNGVVHIELKDASDAATLERRVLAAFGPDAPGEMSRLIQALEGSAMLVVLDNCGHVVEACADVAVSLVSACPRLHVLVTSREVLRVAGEQVWNVLPLALPARGASFDEIAASAAVRLFTARVEQIDPSFKLLPGNAPDVASIALRLDGMPRALELAAGRLSLLSLPQLEAELALSLDVLDGMPATQARHPTLRDAIERDVADTTETQRRVLRRAAVLAGTWTLEAARHVCAADDLTDMEILLSLRELVDKSLVQPVPGPGPARFTLMNVTREHAAHLLQVAGETELTRNAHVAWCRALADAVTAGPERQAQLELVSLDHENLQAALNWALEWPTVNLELVLALAEALDRVWYSIGANTQGLVTFERILCLPELGPDARALVETRAAEHARRLGKLDRAAEHATRAHAHQAEAEVLLDRGDLDGAQRVVVQSDSAWSLASAALIELEHARQDDAAQLSEWSLGALAAGEDSPVRSFVLRVAAQVALAGGDAEDAERLCGDAIAASRVARDPYAEVEALLVHADVRASTGQAVHAARAVYQALAAAHPLDGPLARIRTLERCARVLGPRTGAGLARTAAQHRRVYGMSRWPSELAGLAGFAEPQGGVDGESLAQALQAADRLLNEHNPAARPGAALIDQLTAREREVAHLIARGYSTREVAKCLVISRGTARAHVGNIRTKLGYPSRADIAARLV